MSKTDLIGDDDVRMERSESLVTLKGAPYRIDPAPGGYIACQLALKTDGEGQCKESYLLKFARTPLGNLIVQAQGKDDDSMDDGAKSFLLVARRPDETDACFYILGETEGPEDSPTSMAIKAIAGRFPEELENRSQLSDIADAYEQTVLPLDTNCAEGKMAILSPRNLTFEGDPAPDQDAN
jgi:hypothetical protein